VLPVTDGAQGGSIGDRQQRRGVDDDHVKTVLQRAQGLDHRGGPEQLAGAGRDRLGTHDVDAGLGELLQHVAELGLADQDVGQAHGAVHAHLLQQRRAPQVALDDALPGAPLAAVVIARFAMVVVLPSPGTEEVKAMERGWLAASTK
jgi:hypothetical protein